MLKFPYKKLWTWNYKVGLVLSRNLFICSQFMQQRQRPENIMNVFDRKAKQIQKNRTAFIKDCYVYDYLKEEVAVRMVDRICDVKRKFNIAVELGCWRGHIARHITTDMIGTYYQCEMADKVLEQAYTSEEVPTYKLQVDEEFLPFKENSLDLVVSSLSLHWVNDLPGTFKQIHRCLKNDGVFIAAMFGGDTLFELRVSLQLAEEELEGGFGVHISPFTEVRDLGNLLNRAGYNLITLDIDEIQVKYPGIIELMKDLKGMGENNCAWKRKPMLRRKTIAKAQDIYKEMYGDENGIPATYQIIYLIGWKPDPTQAKSAQRGSATVSIKDLDKINQLIKEKDKDENK